MRKKSNNERMQEYLKRGGTKLNIEKLKYDKNSQDFTLMKGMPIISRRNRKDLNIFNNERFICDSIRKDKIIIKNDNGDKIDIKLFLCVKILRSVLEFHEPSKNHLVH